MNELHIVHGWHCKEFSGHFNCVQVQLCNLVFFCESSVFLSWNLVRFYNNRAATLFTCSQHKLRDEPEYAADLESLLSVLLQVSALQPFWIDTIISCWNVNLLKLTSVTLPHVSGWNSRIRRAKGQPAVGVVKIFCDSDSSGWKSFRHCDSGYTAMLTAHITLPS